jgi:thiamine biosynthesis lipoprotein
MIILLAGLVAVTWWRLQPADGEVQRSQLLMGTVVEIMAGGRPTGQLEDAVDAALAEMNRLDQLFSSYRPDSEISRLSQSASGGEVSSDAATVIALGLEVARRSGGAFDLTLGRLKSLWGIDGDNPVVPDRQAIAAALSGIGPDALSLQGLRLSKRDAKLQLDLGGIAKGYAVDRAIAVLKEHGVTRAAVNAGGDMYLLGQRPTRPWRIGIQHPRQKDAVLATVQVRDRAVVTSGDYERFFLRDGQRYHHIFDPQTGFPARACQSVTVIADSVALGDALATALFVLGPQAGLKLLSHYPGSEALIVAADGSLHVSPGWAQYRAGT